jgi:two-component system, cell cycle sensor histidine kinase and response regulator CckA
MNRDAPAGSATPLSLLVVEDEVIVARDLELTLHSLGYRVAGSVADADAAVLAAERLSPDLVLMDIRLRGATDGISAARSIWDRFGIPVIFLTAYSDEETIGRAQKALPFGFIVKPFLAQQLRPAIEIAVHKFRSERELRHSYVLLRDTLAALSEAVVIVGSDGQLRWANFTATRLLGESAESLSERSLGGLMSAETQWATPSAGQGVLHTRDQRELRVDYGIAPLTIDEGSIGILTFRPTSGASTPVATRPGETAFSRVMSGLAEQVHEPLLALSSTIELVERGGSGAYSGRDTGPLLRRQVERIRELVYELTQYASGETLELEEHPARALVDDAIAQVQPVAQRRRVSFKVTGAPHATLPADRDRLVGAFARILENAVQATPVGGEVRVTIEPASADRLRILIDDSGGGFAPVDLPRIFEPFFSRRPGGTGMGLALALRVAERHGGAIAATNREGGGARITLDLPGQCPS